MATGTQTQQLVTVDVDQQLAEARAKLAKATAEEDRLYAVYQGLALTATPAEVNAARDAYLKACDGTLGALGPVTQALYRKYVVSRGRPIRQRGMGFDSEV